MTSIESKLAFSCCSASICAMMGLRYGVSWQIAASASCPSQWWRGHYSGSRGLPYLLRLGPLRLGQKLVLVAAHHGATDPEHAVVAFLGREALERELDGVGLFFN
jgi:hypothetical protein